MILPSRTKDILNEHASAFTGKSSTYCSATFQAIKEQEKSENWLHLKNTEVYSKTSPIEWFEVANNEGQSLCTWTWQDPQQFARIWWHTENTKSNPKQDFKHWAFPPKCRAAMLILIPKSKKNYTGPLSHRPIALSSCLCKVLGHKINARFIW